MKTIFKGSIELNLDKNGIYSFNLKDLRHAFYLKYISQFVKVKMERKTKVVFEAEKVETLKNYIKNEDLTYRQCESLFIDVGEQIKILEKNEIGYVSLDIDDIIVIFTDKFNFSMIFLNIEKSHFTVKNNMLQINNIFKKSGFISPQIDKISEIPTSIKYRENIFYSLSQVICFCINKIKEKNHEEYKKKLDIILETKLYWALLRCLKDEVENRYYLLI